MVNGSTVMNVQTITINGSQVSGELTPFCTRQGSPLPKKCIEEGCTGHRAENPTPDLDGHHLEYLEQCLNHVHGRVRTKCGSGPNVKHCAAFAFMEKPLTLGQVCVAERWGALPSRFYGKGQDLTHLKVATRCEECITELMRTVSTDGLGCVPVENTELLPGRGRLGSVDLLVSPTNLGSVFAFDTGAAMGKQSPGYSPHVEKTADLHPSPWGASCNAPPLKGLVADSDCSCPILGGQLSELGRDIQGKVVAS